MHTETVVLKNLKI